MHPQKTPTGGQCSRNARHQVSLQIRATHDRRPGSGWQRVPLEIDGTDPKLHAAQRRRTHSQREAIPPEAQELNVVTMVNVPVETVDLFKAVAALRDLIEGPGA